MNVSQKALQVALSALDASHLPEAPWAAARLRAAMQPKEKRTLAQQRRRAAKKAKKAKKGRDTAKVRSHVFKRAEGRCERRMVLDVTPDGPSGEVPGATLVPRTTVIRCGSMPTELHHVFGRARAESSYDCLALCRQCHRDLHLERIGAVRAWTDVVATLKALGLPTDEAEKLVLKARYKEGTQDRYEAVRP